MLLPRITLPKRMPRRVRKPLAFAWNHRAAIAAGASLLGVPVP